MLAVPNVRRVAKFIGYVDLSFALPRSLEGMIADYECAKERGRPFNQKECEDKTLSPAVG